jgi:putative oxidoreductase
VYINYLIRRGDIVKYVLLLGRAFFAYIFIVKAFHHFAGESVAHAESMGVPMAQFLVPFSGVLTLLGGLSILLGYKARVGAWLLIVFLVPITFIMHPFWEMQDGHIVLLHTYCFMKNLSLIGTCLMIAYFGSGPLSLSKE